MPKTDSKLLLSSISLNKRQNYIKLIKSAKPPFPNIDVWMMKNEQRFVTSSFDDVTQQSPGKEWLKVSFPSETQSQTYGKTLS